MEAFHGTVNGYINRKCRCEGCLSAGREYIAQKARDRRAGVTPKRVNGERSHGSYASYSWSGCRCSLCKAAAKEYNNSRRVERQVNRRKSEQAYWDIVVKAKSVPCLDCGNVFPTECMDFDHLPGEEKIYNVSQMKHSDISEVIAEIAKCEVVCANCHRTRTVKRARSVV